MNVLLQVMRRTLSYGGRVDRLFIVRT